MTIWGYIRDKKIKVCDLYEKGYSRVGCIGCPAASKTRYKEFRDFPTFERNYKLAFERMLNLRKEKGLKSRWRTKEDVFNWWMEDYQVPGQYAFDL